MSIKSLSAAFKPTVVDNVIKKAKYNAKQVVIRIIYRIRSHLASLNEHAWSSIRPAHFEHLKWRLSRASKKSRDAAKAESKRAKS